MTFTQFAQIPLHTDAQQLQIAVNNAHQRSCCLHTVRNCYTNRQPQKRNPPAMKLAPECMGRFSVASLGATPAAAVGGTARSPGEGLRRTGACGKVRFLAVASAPALHECNKAFHCTVCKHRYHKFEKCHTTCHMVVDGIAIGGRRRQCATSYMLGCMMCNLSAEAHAISAGYIVEAPVQSCYASHTVETFCRI